MLLDWNRAIPWEDLRLETDDAPGWLARGIISLSRWLAAHLVSVALVVGIIVLLLVAMALIVGLMDRDRALARLQRVAFALAAVLLVASGMLVTLALVLGQSWDAVAP